MINKEGWRDNMIERLELALKKYEDIQQELTKEEVLTDIKKTRELFEALLNKKSLLTTLPYLDEIIDDSDDYIVDREKLLTLKRKIFRF